MMNYFTVLFLNTILVYKIYQVGSRESIIHEGLHQFRMVQEEI